MTEGRRAQSRADTPAQGPSAGARPAGRPRIDDGLDIVDLLGQLTLLGAALLAAVSVLTFFAEQWWIAELFTHFRVQYVTAAIALLAASLALRLRFGSYVLLACIAINIMPMLGYVPLAAPARGEPIVAGTAVPATATPAADAAATPPLRIITTNVRGEKTGVKALVELIRSERPDLFVVLELTPAFAEGLHALGHEYPHRLSAPAAGAFGIGLYSRRPLIDAAVFPLGPTDAVRASVETAAGVVDFVGVHLLPPTNAEWATERNDQLLRIAALVRDRDAHALVCGDFNLTPYSPYFTQLLALTGLRDARLRDGLAWTWPAGFMPLAVPIDHCLAGDELAVEETEVLGDIGSDHYPLLIEIIAGRNG